MKNLFLFITLLLISSLLYGQEKVDTLIIKKIKNEELQNSQIKELAFWLTDVCGPRLTNSPGYRKAVDWTVQTFKQWGLKNAGPEPWGEYGKGWSNEETYLALRIPFLKSLIGYPYPWCKSTSGLLSSNVILLDSFDSLGVDKLGAQVSGKIIMLRSSDTTIISPIDGSKLRFNDSLLNKLHDNYLITTNEINKYKNVFNGYYSTKRYLESKGAAALLTGSWGRDGTVSVDGFFMYSKSYESTLPQLVLSLEDFLLIQHLLTNNQTVKLDMKLENKLYTDNLTGYNVVAEIPGTDPVLKDQVVMLGAHLDSWHSGTGATDDAAGCVATMEAIRILKSLGVKPRRTIRIALWGAEEQGLLGSFGYVKAHFGDPRDMKLKPEQQKISAYFNLDNGTGKIRGIYLQNNENVRDIFTSWLKPFASSGAIGVNSNTTSGTDHLSFDAVGIPAFQFIQDPIEYEERTHHTNMDVYDHLYLEDLKQAATIIAAFVYNAAMRDEMLPRKPLPKPEPFIFENGFVK